MSREYTFEEIKQAAKDAGLDRQHRHELYSSLPPKTEKKKTPIKLTFGMYVRHRPTDRIGILVRNYRATEDPREFVNVFFGDQVEQTERVPLSELQPTHCKPNFAPPIVVVFPENMP